jgi:hypothetical protein
VSYLVFQVMCWATPRVMGSSQRGALRSPRSTWWSTTFPRQRSDVCLTLVLAGSGFRVRVFGDDTDDRLIRSASMTSLTASRCMRGVGMAEPPGSCLLLEVLIVPVYEGSRAKATVAQKFSRMYVVARSTA